MNSSSSVPLVSIIIPAYNRSGFIGETMDSVQAQTYQNWECIVVDDGSTDNTCEVVAEYLRKDTRIKYVHQKNQGAAAARNKGLKNLTGQYIQFWDSDDLIEPLKLELHVRYLEEHADIDIVYSSVRYFRTEEPNERRYSMWEPDVPWMPQVSGTGKEVLSCLVASNIMVISAPMLRRNVIETVGDFDNRLNPLEDWDYWIRCAASGGRMQYLDLEDTLSLVRSHPASLNKNRKQVHRTALLLRQKIARNLRDADLLAINRHALSLLEAAKINEAVEQIRTGQWRRAMRTCMEFSSGSQTYREAVKWLFCALVAPFTPPDRFETVITAPASESILKILRHYFSPLGKGGRLMA